MRAAPLRSRTDVYNDGLGAFRAVVDLAHAHTLIENTGGRTATEAANARWVNIVLSNLKDRWMVPIIRSASSSMPIASWLAEAAWRFSRRFELDTLVSRQLVAAISWATSWAHYVRPQLLPAGCGRNLTMKHLAPLFVALVATTSANGCANGAPAAGRAIGTDLARYCASINDNERVAIRAYGGKAVSVCVPGDETDCLYSEEAGKTFQYATPDFNADGRADAVIKDFTGAYGQHDVVHVMAFAQCGDGNYVLVADDMLQDLSVAPSANAGWADLQVTRSCYNEALGDNQTRHFRLTFDAARFRYGPPDNDPELAEFCSAKELSLPADATPPSSKD